MLKGGQQPPLPRDERIFSLMLVNLVLSKADLYTSLFRLNMRQLLHLFLYWPPTSAVLTRSPLSWALYGPEEARAPPSSLVLTCWPQTHQYSALRLLPPGLLLPFEPESGKYHFLSCSRLLANAFFFWWHSYFFFLAKKTGFSWAFASSSSVSGQSGSRLATLYQEGIKQTSGE